MKLCEKKFARSGQAARHAKVHRGVDNSQNMSYLSTRIQQVISQVGPEVQLAMSSLLQQ
jgi:hypothetical protein